MGFITGNRIDYNGEGALRGKASETCPAKIHPSTPPPPALLGLTVGNRPRRRGNLTRPVSNVCEAAPKSFLWAPNEIFELSEVRFKFSFNLIWQIDDVFLEQIIHCAYSNPGSQVGAEQRFWRCFADGLNLSLILSVAQAITVTEKQNTAIRSL